MVSLMQYVSISVLINVEAMHSRSIVFITSKLLARRTRIKNIKAAFHSINDAITVIRLAPQICYAFVMGSSVTSYCLQGKGAGLNLCIQNERQL
jgi:hypothetical protein